MTALGQLAGATGLRLATLATSLVSGIVIARILGPEDRGLFQVVITISLLTATVGGLSGEIALAERFGRESARRGTVLATGAWGGLAWGLAIGLITLPGVMLFVSQEDAVQPVLLFVVAQVIICIWQIWQQRSLLLSGRPSGAAMVLFCDATLRLLFVGVLVSLGDATLAPILAAASSASLVALLLGMLAARVGVSAFDVRDLMATLRRGVKYHAGQLALAALMRLDVVLLATLGGLVATGIYAVSVSLTAPLIVLATSISTAFLHRQYTGTREEHVAIALRLVTLTYVILLPCVVIACLVVPPVVPKVWGQEYVGAVVPTLALLPGVLALSVQRPLSNALVREGMHRELNLRSILAVLVNVLLGVILIPSLQSVGAAVASSIAYVVYAAMSFHAFSKVADRPVRDLVQECLGWKSVFNAVSKAGRARMRAL